MPVHLHVHSAFSFQDGTSYPEGLVEQAAAMGYQALALTDHNNLCGAVRFVQAAASAGIRPILGVELTLECGHVLLPHQGMNQHAGSLAHRAGGEHLTLLAADPTGYSNLCRLISLAHDLGGRRTPALPRERLEEYSEGLIALSGCRRGEVPQLLLGQRPDEARQAAAWYARVFPGRFFLEVQRLYVPREQWLLQCLSEMGKAMGIPLAASVNVHYLRPSDMPVHDILTCARELVQVDEAHPARPFNAEQSLLSPKAFARRFRDMPQAVANTRAIASLCQTPALELTRPDVPVPVGFTGDPLQALRAEAYKGAARRYGRVTPAIRSRLEHELGIIARVGCASYFLVVQGIVRQAKSMGIRTSGRGSVVDSAVGHCLGISDIDPIRHNLLFERFMSPERSQMPDIDIDFPRDKRDELVTWVQKHYGPQHVGAVCTFSTFRARSALREIGKAMGLPAEELGVLARRLRAASADQIEGAMESQPQAVHLQSSAKRYTHLFEMCARVAGLPRMISTHLGGIVITSQPIHRYTPTQPSARGIARLTHFDKDDIEAVGLKIDLLSLPILGAVDNAGEACRYEDIPEEDPETIRQIRAGESIGTFELQSPAQRALHIKVQTSSKKDIIDSIALIRPGPVQGGMAENYVRRKLGLEPVTYIHPSLEPSLKHTYGIALFQEQVIEIACAAANFTPGEADILRKAMTSARSKGNMEKLRESFTAKALENGLTSDQAERIFTCISGFAGYGFTEGHARAFAEIAYRSAYLLRHHPAHYMAGLLNNQPMGMYPVNTLIAQARNRGVAILPLDVNRSQWFSTSTDDTLRVGLHLLKGLSRKTGERIAELAPYTSALHFCQQVRPAIHELQNLITAGAFESLHPNRRGLLWQADSLLEMASQGAQERLLDCTLADPHLEDFGDVEKMSLEYDLLGLTANCHLASQLRPRFDAMGLLTTQDLAWIPGGQKVRVGGLTVCPHTPPTRSGHRVLFFCLEDEFGMVDVTAFEDVYRASGYVAFSEPVLVVEGVLQKRNLGRTILARRVSPMPRTLSCHRASTPKMELRRPHIGSSAAR